MLAELLAYSGVEETASQPVSDSLLPMLPIKLQVKDQVLNLFSLIATIGMSADAALDDIRIENLLPDDEETRLWFSDHGSTGQ